MGIFIKRPLCLFCFSFMAASLLACFYNGRYNLYLFLACLLAFITCFSLSFIIKKRRYGLIEAAIACLMAVLAFVSSYIFVYRAEENAKELCGDEITVEFVVLKKNYTSRYSSSYDGTLVSVNGREVSVPSVLKCDYEEEYAIGDTVFTLAIVSRFDESDGVFCLPDDVLLCVTPSVEREQAYTYPSEMRFDVLCAKLREAVRLRFVSILDFDCAALSVGLVTGDKALMDTEVIRNFRRSGLSHVLAVSGLHLAIVVGSAELLLRKLYVRKSVRCVILSLLSFLLLMLSGFSASASRSVVMLLLTYLVFILSEDSDALTSLGVAGFVILLFSPRTVGDVGFWLSFLATFGLVTWLSLMTPSTQTVKMKKRFHRFIHTTLGKVFMVFATSICATLSIAVVSWLIFGEISVIGPLANLVVTPLCEVYLVFSLIAFVFGGIPFISSFFSLVATSITWVINALTSFFASQSFAVFSLKYVFAGVIIAVATAAMCVFLVIEIQHKKLILAIPAAAIVAFFVCLGIYNMTYDGTRVTYINNGSRDGLVLTSGKSAVVFDVSDGTYTQFGNAVGAAAQNYATELSSVVLTHYHAKHISSLDSVLRNEMVRKLYIPLPLDDEERALAHDIARTAEEHKVTLIIYSYGEGVPLSDTMSFCVFEPDTQPKSDKKIVNFSVMTDGKIITYADSSWELSESFDRVERCIEVSDTLILGSHGPQRPKGTPVSLSLYEPQRVIASARDDEGLSFNFYIPSK